MPREFSRASRVSEVIQREVAVILQTEMKDPRVAEVTITYTKMSRDMSTARVHFTRPGDEEAIRDTLRVWERRYGFPVPFRNNKGERLYPKDQLRRLQRIRRLLDQGFDSASRVETYARTVEAIRDYVLLGSGLGTFQDVFPAYRLELSAGRHVWDKAHNDYLELILGLGVPAAMLVLLSFILLFYRSVRGFFVRHRDGHYSAISAAVCILVGLHSLVDFSLQIQANTLVLALLLGLGLAQSKSSRN